MRTVKASLHLVLKNWISGENKAYFFKVGKLKEEEK